MRRFTRLYRLLDASMSTAHKVDAMVDYFRGTDPSDAAWAAYVLAGGKPRQAVPRAVLRSLACELAGIDPWLFDASYAVAGDLAETIAYVLPEPSTGSDLSLSEWIEQRILPLRGQSADAQRAAVASAWDALQADERFIYVKLIGGGLRVGVSRLLVQRALARVAGLDPKIIAQRMIGYTDSNRFPDAQAYLQLLEPAQACTREGGSPYPFFLAHPLTMPPHSLGSPTDWLMEWKYDGIRAQIVRRADASWIWTRGEELANARFPELMAQASNWPEGSVLDGEILVWRAGETHPAAFSLLQRRIQRRALGPRILAEAPIVFLAYDLLEYDRTDLRDETMQARRARLEAFARQHHVRVSPRLHACTWDELAERRAESRSRGMEGLMLKALDSRYGAGRTRSDGIWWKWKIEPHTVDAVLVYAQGGHGRRANVYTDYTFAVWNRAPEDAQEAATALAHQQAQGPRPIAEALQLVPFAKAYSGLTDAELADVDRVIRKTTIERFGPVRAVSPTMVFELAFEGISRSKRHRAGIAVRFPRIVRRRDDKAVWQADSLQALEALLPT